MPRLRVKYTGWCIYLSLSSGLMPSLYRYQQGGRWISLHSSSERDQVIDIIPSVEEAIAGAEQYLGPDIRDPIEIHPNELPILDDFTCENFTMYYDEGGHAPWDLTVNGVARLRLFNDIRALKGLDHIFWAQASNSGTKSPRVESSYQLLDTELDLPQGQFVVAIDGKDKDLADFLRSDPEPSTNIAQEVFWHFELDDDPYLSIHVFPSDMVPFIFWRLYTDEASTKKKDLALQEHTSFMRKTKRIMRHARLSHLSDKATKKRKYCGELFVAFFTGREEAITWANADPLQVHGYFDPLESSSMYRYNDLDVTGTQKTSPYPLNLFPDPVLSRLVDDGLKPLQVKSVQRMQPDPATGEYRLYNITTNDPRVQSNVIDITTLDPMRINSAGTSLSSEASDDEDDSIDIGLTLDAAPDLSSDVTDDFDA